MAHLAGLPQWYRDLPVSGKLNLFIVLAVVVPLLLLVGLYTNLARGLIVDNSIDAEVRNLDLVAGSIESIFLHADALSRIIVADDFLQEVGSESYRRTDSSRFENEYRVRIILDGIIQRRDVVSSGYVRFNDGRVFGSGHIDTEVLLRAEDELNSIRGIFPASLSSPAVLPTRSTPYHVAGETSNSLALVRRFISVDSGAVIGQIVLNIDELTIRDVLRSSNADSRSRSYLVGAGGTILSSSFDDALYSSIEGVGGPAPFPSGAGGHIATIDGERSLLTFRSWPDIGWSLLRISPLASILRPSRSFTFQILAIGLLCLVLAISLSLPIVHSVTNPVRNLTEAMDLAGQGDLEVRVEEHGNDEIGKMTRYFNKMVGEISDLMAEVYQEQSDKRRFELMALQAQIRPHFLYNALDGVCTLVQMERNEDAYRMGKALSLFYRGALSGGRNVISLREELHIVEHYLTIQSLRYAGQFEYQIDVPEHLLDRRALKLSLQPLVENSIYHGLRGTERTGMISISAHDEGARYVLVVHDNGRGFPDADADGFGLRSVRERVRLYFGQAGRVSVNSVPGDTTVRLHLPVPRGDHG
jgi:two-component system sensor histidine kinase YesM